MSTLERFLEKWLDSEGSERSHSQHFLIDLCDLVGLPRPGTKRSDDFRFEKAADFPLADGIHHGRADLVRRGSFLIESKQFSKRERSSKAWNLGMQEALGQALGYAKTLPDAPIFVIACDVGHCFELLACFDGSGQWRPFPTSANRIYLAELRDPKRYKSLAAALRDPSSLDPSHKQLEVTKDVAGKIAELAQALRVKHDPEAVARFLMRCLFTMFAEDVGLFEGKRKIFAEYLRDYWIPHPASFPGGVSVLWQTMNTGGTMMTGERVLKFNGGLFRDHSALSLTKVQLEVLFSAATRDWSQVEPAIFGTLLENALNAKDRHALGAHFTPRAYVERLVRPTIEEPLRAEWLVVRAQVRNLLSDTTKKSDEKAALRALKSFHSRLCKIRVLDPACGTGNFLYVAMDLLKQLEAEVLEQINRVGGSAQELLELDTITVSPRSFLGIEKNPWAKEIAELVLWIGYLRWQWRLRGSTAIAQGGEPILRDDKNIECRDAVLDWDGAPSERLKLGETGRPVTRWDGETTKRDPLTGLEVPDLLATVCVREYPTPRRAKWPEADFIVGNPPFLGKLRLLSSLGEGYVAALRKTYAGDVPDSADFVMYWWHLASQQVLGGRTIAAGLVTTNSIGQVYNRRVVAAALESDQRAHLGFVIPDHPWVDAEAGAAVRIAMTTLRQGPGHGVLRLVLEAKPTAAADGAMLVELSTRAGVIHADLSIGADLNAAKPLQSNAGLASAGVMLGGRGFLLKTGDSLSGPAQIIKPILNGNDILQKPRGCRVIDFFGHSLDEAREVAPAALQRLIDGVKPSRDANSRPGRRDRWWLFSETMPRTRRITFGLRRYICTPETSTHRIFTFIDGAVLPEHPVLAIGSEDAFVLGVLSSKIHVAWSTAAGGRLGKGNDPRYNKTRCFEPFPFPVPTATQTTKIGKLAEQLDAHRKRQIALNPDLTITGMYNVLEKLQSGKTPLEKERVIHEDGLVSILKQLHEELDTAIFKAYGWDSALSDEEICEKLVTLNAERAAEEAAGKIRYLRPEFQIDKTEVMTRTEFLVGPGDVDHPSSPPPPVAVQLPAKTWPSAYLERATALRDVVQSLPEGARFEAGTLDAHFKGKSKSRLTEIGTILETFAALGQFVTLAPGYYGRPIRRTG